MNFVRGIDPKNAMKIGASQTLIPKMIQDFIDSNPDIYEVYIFTCFFCVYTKKNPFIFFKIWRYFKKAGLKQYIKGLFRWTIPKYRSSFLIYYLIKEENYFMFDVLPKEGDKYPRFQKTEAYEL